MARCASASASAASFHWVAREETLRCRGVQKRETAITETLAVTATATATEKAKRKSLLLCLRPKRPRGRQGEELSPKLDNETDGQTDQAHSSRECASEEKHLRIHFFLLSFRYASASALLFVFFPAYHYIRSTGTL